MSFMRPSPADSVLPSAGLQRHTHLAGAGSLCQNGRLGRCCLSVAIGAKAVVDRLSRVTGPYRHQQPFAVHGLPGRLWRIRAFTDAYVAEVVALP